MAIKLMRESSAADKHSANVSVVFTICDNRVVSGSDDGILKLWDSELNLVSQTDTQSGAILSVTTAENKLYTVTSDQTVKVWDRESLQNLATLETNSAAPLKIVHDSNTLWIGDAEGRVTKLEDEKVTGKFELTEEIWDLCVTTNSGPTHVYTARDRDIVFSEIVTGALRSTAVVKGTIQGRYPILILDNILCCLNREGRNINVHENNAVNRFPLQHEFEASSLIINALCRGVENTVYSGGYDKVVGLWDISTGTNLGNVDVGTCVNALANSKNGAYAALSDGRVVLIGP